MTTANEVFAVIRERGPVRASDIATACGCPAGNFVTSIIKQLEREGSVTKELVRDIKRPKFEYSAISNKRVLRTVPLNPSRCIEILHYLHSFPWSSATEIGNAIGLSPDNVRPYTDRLIKKGFVERDTDERWIKGHNKEQGLRKVRIYALTKFGGNQNAQN